MLLKDVELRLGSKETIGLIGRNGCGKSTLFRILLGRDNDFDGEVHIPSTEVLMSTEQEHALEPGTTTYEYITSRLPHFTKLKHIIDTYPQTMGEDSLKQAAFSDAITEFSERGYFDIRNTVESLFDSYQLRHALLEQDFSTLSGGQKRFCDLIAIQIAKPTIVLLDEPTNHMDYIAKEVFLDWLKSSTSSAILISHDRDVLQQVDKIVEIRDMTAYTYPGNYHDYLVQNSSKTVGLMQGYETTQKRIDNLREQIQYANAKARSQAGQQTGRGGKNKWVVLKARYQKELDELEATNVKPEFWIDKQSVQTMAPKITDKYHRYKAKNISLKVNDSEAEGLLLDVHELSLGYGGTPLFSSLSFQLRPKDRLRIVGRNGTGKTTLLQAISQTAAGTRPETLIGKGVILPHRSLRLSRYHQELPMDLQTKTLFGAIEDIFRAKQLPMNEQKIRSLMASYLFDPIEHAHTPVHDLSGGQKARLQLIDLLAGNPSLLILDEPTNHLDLPSIEELETALQNYSGAILFVSHDSYFANTIGGTQIMLQEAKS